MQDFIEVTGRVVDGETWSESHVNGSGSGAAYNGMGTYRSTIRTAVLNVSKLWVETDDGREIAVLTDANKFSTRIGHRVSVLAGKAKSGSLATIAAINHDTGETTVHKVSAVKTIWQGTWVTLVLALLSLMFVVAFPPIPLIVVAGMMVLTTRTVIANNAFNGRQDEFLAKYRGPKTQSPPVHAALKAA